ncbi:MAG: type IV pilus modification PilV family protein [Thermodesulfobacteriota bacterium]
MMQSVGKNSERGFTLLEVLIAVAIFTIGILAVNAMQISAIGGNATANRVTESTNWASDRIETLLALSYSHADLDDDNGDGAAGFGATGANADGTAVSPDGAYTISWNVAEDDPFPDIKTVNVVVERQVAGLARTVTMTYAKSNSM